MDTNGDGRQRQIALGISLAVLLIAVYFVTYSGYAISRDEWFLFDATESLARRGTLAQNLQLDAYPPLTLGEAQPPPVDAEPLQPALAAPLFLMAQALPGIGLAHTVWLFNVLVTALTAGVLYAYGLALGYRARAAALTALAFGLGTIAWPYSRTFFREPLFTLLGLLSAYLVLRTRQRFAAGRPALGVAALSALVIGATLLTKEAALLLLPAVISEALPARLGRLQVTRRWVTALIALILVSSLLVIVALNADTLFGLSNRYAFVMRAQQARDNLAGVSAGVRGYLFSPARSLWLFSPALIPGLAGAVMLIRARRWRQLAVPLVALVAFVVGYAAVRGPEQWYGGRGWGPRYMVPLTPFLALWLLPVFAHVLRPHAARWARFGAALVILAGIGVQLLGSLVPLDAYYELLAGQSPPIIPWDEGAWSLRWSPVYVSATLLDDVTLDVAWRHAIHHAWLLPVLSAALAGAAAGWAWHWLRRPAASRRRLWLTVASLGLGVVLALGGGLAAIRLDPRYSGEYPPARALLAALDEQIRSDDVIVLDNDRYTPFFMNYYKRAAPVVYTLPHAPGERSSPEQAPDVVSANPDELIHLSAALVIGDLARRHERLWLVLESSRFVPWSVRPYEQYLARHYFPMREVAPSDLARAVLYDLTPAPPPTASAWPDTPIGATFGGALRLVGADLPGGEEARAGKPLAVSLLWEAVGPIERDYTVAVLLVSAQGELIAQRDALPVGGFAPMSGWSPGALIRDNHALELPAGLPPGDYELWAVVYWWQTPDERLPVSSSAGVSLGDHALIATLTVR
ncbi:MAG: hypothetical protein OZ934_01410 [Anaerolineae bacterium]|nr:hypothetical protein [Anaerolineae bacterium]